MLDLLENRDKMISLISMMDPYTGTFSRINGLQKYKGNPIVVIGPCLHLFACSGCPTWLQSPDCWFALRPMLQLMSSYRGS